MLSFVEKGGLVDPSNSGCHGERPQQWGKHTAVLENEGMIWEILPKSPDGDWIPFQQLCSWCLFRITLRIACKWICMEVTEIANEWSHSLSYIFFAALLSLFRHLRKTFSVTNKIVFFFVGFTVNRPFIQ